MRVLAALAALLLLPSAALAAEPKTTLADVEDEVMCIECGTALNLSTSGVADRERAFITREIEAGRTKDEIKQELLDRFGPSVLALPEGEGFGLAAYLVPALAILLAAIAVVLALRRWRERAPEPATMPELSEEDARRVDRELEGLD